MTIVLDSASAESFSAVSSVTHAHTCAGANRVLLVGMNCPNASDYITPASPPTYNGVAMTQVANNNVTGTAIEIVWALVNPPVGTFNILFTPTSPAHINLHAVSFAGVDQTTWIDSTSSFSETYGNTPRSTAITLAAGSVAVSFFMARLSALTLTPGSGQTLAASVIGTSVSTSGASYKTDATAMEWAFTGSQPAVVHVVVGLKAAAAVGATETTLSGPSSGTTGVASSNFTVGANGTITGTVTVTPGDAGNGGTFSPTTVAISSGTPTATFTYTPASTGVKTISITDDGGLTDATSLSYTSNAASSGYAPALFTMRSPSGVHFFGAHR